MVQTPPLEGASVAFGPEALAILESPQPMFRIIVRILLIIVVYKVVVEPILRPPPPAKPSDLVPLTPRPH